MIYTDVPVETADRDEIMLPSSDESDSDRD
jgi:hypothetical protein